MGKQYGKTSRIAVKHVNVMDRVKPAPVINWALARDLFAGFGALPFTVRKVA